MKTGLFLLKCPDTIRIEDMKMDIEIKASAELLEKGNRACPGSGFFLETGFFDKKLCIELFYKSKKAIIEPYAFRKNKEGHILLYGCHHRTKKTDSFEIESIQSADITDKPFTPKYIVEIG